MDERALGYSLTGDCSEQYLFIAYGNGANGKFTFETLKDILGSYAVSSEFDTFLAKDIANVREQMEGIESCKENVLLVRQRLTAARGFLKRWSNA